MADTRNDIIVLGFRQTLYTRVERGPRKPDGTPGDIIKTEENVPDYWAGYYNRNSVDETGNVRSVTWERIRFLDPEQLRLPEGVDGSEKVAFLNWRWNQIKPHFEAWLSGQKVPEHGIALGAWPALTEAQVKALQSIGLRSVEDVRDMTENEIGRVRLPNARDLKKMAGQFIDGLSAEKVAERERGRDAQIADLTEKLEAAMALIAEQAEANAETQGGRKPRVKDESKAA